ncbi:RHS repeat-associated core domain-containing protein [Actinomadura sp. 6K520]|uniref:RHS repeat-associated core domain-containing protein n=1 Tax=Actinomadura sp. 6K520 TaxID=2530364 RepID=UPI0010457E94|nr:RHS repeat-associated core domain-containing protein [Actinomadura sp. 6K520]TDE21966.1 sugar-binding protein [Actinomadura sp. 6K520]
MLEDVVNAGRKVSGRSHGKTLVLGSGRLLSATAVVMAVVMPAGLLSASPALADPPNSGRPTVDDHQEPVDGKALKVRPRKPDPATKPGPAARTVRPAPGSAEVEVPTGSQSARVAGNHGAQKAGDLPIEILPPTGQKRGRSRVEWADRVRVQVLDRDAAHAVGVDGVAFTVARTDAPTSGRVRLRLGYSKFEQAFGGAYGARLRLMRLPQCALTTPAEPGCRTPVPLETVNDGEGKTLTAEVEAAPTAKSGSSAAASTQGNATLLVAAADSGSSQGDYKATSLSPSATWEAGGSAGDFTWSYPMRVPPVPGALTPKVAVSYSSGSVDGRTANTNGQPSWVGEGFDLWPGFIERRYKSCKEDGAPKDEWGNSPGDQCWAYDNATVAWNGQGGELIKASDGTWRMKNDDGTRFEKLASSSNNNGDNNGEYWKVTATDGTQYYFGLNRVPGWTNEKPETNSAWTLPVFGDDSGEPCHDSTFASSWCQQAYRWNLDYVVDPGGNAILYTYGKETNHYGRNLKAEDETPYVRGGFLKTISYGLRKDALFAKAPAQVTFTTSERCIPDANFDCAPSKIDDNPDKWWDVPWDLNCNSGQECKDDHGAIAPSFWSRKRLTKVATQILKPDGSGYRPVDSWSMNHDWGLADVERDLFLEEIEHTGHSATDGGGAVTMPKVTFAHVQMPNRLDESGDDILAYYRYRLSTIYDEAGGQIDIAYSDTDCSLSNKPTPETNTTRCMPVIWQPPGREEPITDWFHKYVVTSVIQTDRTGLAPDMATKYEYMGGAAWHFDDDDGLTKEKDKTWSQWRGYGHVRTFTGNFADPATQSDTYYMRGMDGDRQTESGGTKSVSISDGEGGTYTDHNALAGFPLRTVEYTEPGGSVHSKTVNRPWRVQTASRTRSWGTVTANVIGVDTARTWTAKDGGDWLQTKIDNTFKDSGPGVGRVISVNDLGDVTTDADDKCTRTTYADNTGAWMVDYPSRVETVAVACTAAADRPDQVISDVRSYYDDQAHGTGPTKGQATKVEDITGYDGGTPVYATKLENTYDPYGRVTQSENVLGQVTTTTYTETQGLTTKETSTTPPANPADSSSALTSSQELDPAWGLPIRTTDANGQVTDLVYDGMGRLRKVWRPDRSKANNDDPSHEYKYQFTDGQIVAVTSKAIVAGSLRVTGISLLDGWLRPRQAQSPTQALEGQSRRLITDTFYDDRGQVVKTYATYPATGAPEAALFGVGTPGAVETQTRTSYDGLGRPTVQRLTTGNGSQPDAELWRTTYDYGGGNRVSVTPPDGGTPTAEITNALGQVIERRQYKADTPTGDYDATTYAYTPAGQISSVTDPSGNAWSNTYDLRGRKTQSTDPDKGTTLFTYDDLDRLTSTTDARGKAVFANYDGLGRVTDTREGSAGGSKLTSFTYDTVTRGKGRLASATRHHNGAQYTSNIRRYDELGRVHTATVTIPSVEGVLAGTYSSVAEYNSDGSVQSFRPPVAGGLPYETLTYSYDDLVRPIKLSSDLHTYIGDISYRETGEVEIVDYGSVGKRAFQTFEYQRGTRRLDRAATSRENIGGSARAATYHYTDAGTITSITDVSHDGVDNQCFSYDPLQRLTQAWTQGTTDECAAEPADNLIGGPAPYWHTFTYDKAGNRTKEIQHGIGGDTDTVRTYTHAAPGQGSRLNTLVHTGPDGDRTQTYGYDATGNTTSIQTTENPGASTQTFEWNTEGELAKSTEEGNDVTFVYDAGGNRLIRKDPTGSTLYLPGGTELRVYNGASTATGTRYYELGGQPVAMRTADGTVTYLTSDHHGTAQIAVNAATQAATVRRFTPFGAVRALDDDATWPNDKGFLGGTRDPTDLTHLGAREYDPDTGRFISVDPVLNQADPQQMNGYTYANNSPVTFSDPTGTCPGNSCSADFAYTGPHRRTPKRNVSRGWSSGGSSRVARVMATFGGCSPADVATYRCATDQMIRERLAVNNPGPPPTTGWLPVVIDALDLIFDIRNTWSCLTGKSAGACGWTALSFVPFVGKLFRPGSKFLRSTMKQLAKKGDDAPDPPKGSTGGPSADPPPAKTSSPKQSPKTSPGGPSLRKSAPAEPPPTQCNSFVPGTPVLLADGGHRAIEDIRVGDKVLATNPETGETSPQPVLGTITTKGDKDLVRITVNTDAPVRFRVTGEVPQPSLTETRNLKLAKSGVVVATGDHPFWVAGDINAWVKATDLEPGMWLRTNAGIYAQLTAIKRRAAQDQRVHNLTIASTHTYYVQAGATSVLTHNIDPCKISGPYHRVVSRSQSVEGVRQIIDSAEVWGRTARGGARPAVQAYPGPLPEGTLGVEFYTEATPTEWAWTKTGRLKPGLAYVQWHTGNEGVIESVDGEFAQIGVIISKFNLPG